MTQKRLLGAYAHPDDEQGVSGLMCKYARTGAEVTLVCATRGEAGQVAPGVSATAETLGQVREAELRCAAEKIGIRHVYFLDYRDSGMFGAPENNDPRALWQANVLEVAEKLTRLIRRHQPQVMLTFDPQGGYGHPDHIKIHHAALIAYLVADDVRIFPEQITGEGLSPWAVSKLYWNAFPRRRIEQYVKLAQLAGLDLGVPLKEFLKRAVPDEAITTRIDVAEFVDVKLGALFCHASQMNPNSIWNQIPPEMRRAALATEMLIRAESRVVVTEEIETDLFTGIE
jgi:LmbE family N-acetylglucosaminyl deacetylase